MIRLLFIPFLLLGAELVDRLALTVGTEIITEQQVLLHLRTAAMLNEEPVLVNAYEKRRAAQKLIELALIRLEMQNNRYPLPEKVQVETALKAIQDQRFSGDDSVFQNALKRYQITESDLRDSLKWQLAILSFIEFRFRPGVQISEEEMRDFYQYDYADRSRKSYELSRTEILELLTQQRIDNLLDRWLTQTESATKVRWIESVFAEPKS